MTLKKHIKIPHVGNKWWIAFVPLLLVLGLAVYFIDQYVLPAKNQTQQSPKQAEENKVLDCAKKIAQGETDEANCLFLGCGNFFQ